jgi:hypothetical protein
VGVNGDIETSFSHCSDERIKLICAEYFEPFTTAIPLLPIDGVGDAC